PGLQRGFPAFRNFQKQFQVRSDQLDGAQPRACPDPLSCRRRSPRILPAESLSEEVRQQKFPDLLTIPPRRHSRGKPSNGPRVHRNAGATESAGSLPLQRSREKEHARSWRTFLPRNELPRGQTELE